MGYQAEVLQAILKKKADYIIAIKRNQPWDFQQIADLFK